MCVILFIFLTSRKPVDYRMPNLILEWGSSKVSYCLSHNTVSYCLVCFHRLVHQTLANFNNIDWKGLRLPEISFLTLSTLLEFTYNVAS